MRRALLYIALGLCALLLLVLLGFSWILNTAQGARFALNSAGSVAGVELSVQGVQGRLRDRLQLSGIRWAQPKLRAEIDRLDLVWEPGRLLNWNLLVHELAVSGVRVQDDRPPSAEPPQLRWPQVSGALRRLSAQVSRLRLTGVSYRHLQDEPVLLTELSSALSFRNDLLTVSDLVLLLPEGRVSGGLAAGLWRPSLTLDVTAALKEPVQEMDFFSLTARLLPGRSPEQVAGGIALAGRSKGARHLELTGELGIAVNALNLRGLRLTMPGRRGTLTGSVSTLFSKPEPLFSAALQVTDLDLARELQMPTSLSGTLNFSGGMSSFLGNFALANKGPGWQNAALAAQYRGGSTGVKLAPLSGTLLGGRLAGALDLLWSKGLRVSGKLAGRGLDPGQLAPEWKGRINLDLTGHLVKPEKGVMSGELRSKLLESRLRGRRLQGELNAGFAGGRLRLDRLLLTGAGFQLRGAGELDRRIDLAARVTDLSGLVPGAAGRLQADAWVRRREGIWAGAVRGEGAGLAAAGISMAALRLDARLGERPSTSPPGAARTGQSAASPGPEYPIFLDASLDGLQAGQLVAETARLTLQGTTASHTLTAELTNSTLAAGATTVPSPVETPQGGAGKGATAGVSPATAAAPPAAAAHAARIHAHPPPASQPVIPEAVLVGNPAFHYSTAGSPIAAFGDDHALSGRRAPTRPADQPPPAHPSLAELRLALAGGYGAGVWRGELTGFSGRDAVGPWSLAAPTPLLLSADRVRIAPLVIEGVPGERLELSGDLSLQPVTGTLRGAWDGLNLARANAWLAGLQLAGASSGDLDLRLLPARRIMVAGRIGARGTVLTERQRLDLERFQATLDGDRTGLRAAVDLALHGGAGQAQLRFDSPDPASLALPERGDLILKWSDLDLALLRPAPGSAAPAAPGSASATGAAPVATPLPAPLLAAPGAAGAPGEIRVPGADAAIGVATPATVAVPVAGSAVVAGSAPAAPPGSAAAPADSSAAADVIVEGRSAGVVQGKLLPGGRLDLKGETSLEQGHVNWQAQGDEFDAVIDTARASFGWRGSMTGAGKGAADALQLNAQVLASGVYSSNGERIAVLRGTLEADAGPRGTRAGLDLALEEGGGVKLAISSASPASLGIPETGDFTLEWGGIESALLQPMLPGALNLQGQFAGRARGRLLPGKRLEMSGLAEFAQGRARWQGESGEVNANVRSATLDWNWRGETLSGTLDLALAEYGKADGSFVLPIPARLPVLPNRNGAVQGALAGKVQERGFLTAFLPGMVQESHGELALDLRLAGIWSDPRLTGALQLSQAGAYLPPAGIRVSDLELSARLAGDELRIDKFRAVSGNGHIEGSLAGRMEGWRLAHYSGTLSGAQFQTVYLPELQMVTSPQLSFDGGPDKITLRGDVTIPEMLVSGPPVRQIVTPSGDVILEGAPPAPEEKPLPLALDGRIQVVLGDKVEVKASGIDAQLGGSMYLVLKGMESITSSGEIKVVKGRYRAYGMDLEIVRGRLYYVDDPVDQPTLDILALRSVGEVRAGVTVAGYLNAPVVKLYSEPAMPEVDILAYMVLGHPMGASSEQGSLLATAATSLFSLGESSSVQEQIKDRLGLSVLGVQTVDTSRAGLMGYKEIPVSPTGEAPAQAATGQSLLTVGKYLTPELYLSYGRSLVTGENLFILRYDITRRIQLETQSGSESGADLYYKMEFN